MTRSSKEAWDSNRPVFSRLPAKGYLDNPVADWLTQWTDDRLMAAKATLESWYLELSPDTCKDSSLDYLAFLVGLSGPYWDVRWSPEVKRSLIRIAHNVLWSRKGTLDVIELVLNIHQISYTVWLDTLLILDFPLGLEFGNSGLRLYLRLPLLYQRSSQEWKEAQRTLDLYCPVVVENLVCHEYFYLDFDLLGDPMF